MSRLCPLLLRLLSTAVASSRWSAEVGTLLKAMTLTEKVGLCTQIDVGALTDKVGWLDPQRLQTYLGDYAIGSVLNTVSASVRERRRGSTALIGGCICDGDTCVSTTSLSYWQNLTSTLSNFSMAKHGIPNLYGLDSVHGAVELDGAAWFPHNIGLAASFNPDLVSSIATVAALDTRAMGCAWMFAPVLGLGIQPLWSRFYETPGKDPHVGSVFGASFSRGVDAAGAGLAPVHNFSVVVPTIKHYMGYSSPRSGKDRTDAWIPDHYLKQYFQVNTRGVRASAASHFWYCSPSKQSAAAAAAAAYNPICRIYLYFMFFPPAAVV